MLNGVKLVAVDLDGTLVDSAPDLAFCVDRALESIGLAPAGEARARAWIGDGIDHLLAEALEHAASGPLEAELREHAKARFDACYALNLFSRSTVYPGVPETLDVLCAADFRIACVTNKREAFATGLLAEAGLLERLEIVLGGDSLPYNKPHPAQLLELLRRTGLAADDAVLVGDSEHDYGAASSAGIAFIWAGYGYRAELEADGPLTRIDEFAELAGLLGCPAPVYRVDPTQQAETFE